MQLNNAKINFIGDSITEGIGTTCREAMFSEIIAKQTGAKIRNYGISATRIANQIKIVEDIDTKSFCQRFDTMDNDTDIILIFGGTNDYGHGDAPFGKFSDRTPETFCGALHYLMNGLITKYPSSQIVFLTPLHRENENVPNESNSLPLKAYVDKIRETAEYYSLPVLDLYAEGGIYPDNIHQKELYCPDGLHPNDAGNEKIAKKIIEFLKTL